MQAPELRGVRLLADLTNSQLDELFSYGKVLRVPAGELVVRQGDAADALFLLLEGKVGAYFTDEKGNEIHLQTIESGGHFGEIGLLEPGKRTASLRAVAPCFLFRLDVASFQSLLRAPALAAPFLYGLCRSLGIRLTHLTNRFAEIRSFQEAWTV